MKYFAALVLATLTLAACQPTTEGAAISTNGAKQLATQSDMTAIIGKTLTLNQGQSFSVSADGTLSGSWDGNPLVGTYRMRDGFFCRTLSQGPRGPSPEDCQLLVLDGDMLRATRNRGNGSSFTYAVS